MAIKLMEVTIPGCVACARFKKLWEDKLSKEFPNVEFETIDATEPGGQEILIEHTIFATPGLLINGEVFSTGPVNEKKLRAKLEELGNSE